MARVLTFGLVTDFWAAKKYFGACERAAAGDDHCVEMMQLNCAGNTVCASFGGQGDSNEKVAARKKFRWLQLLRHSRNAAQRMYTGCNKKLGYRKRSNSSAWNYSHRLPQRNLPFL